MRSSSCKTQHISPHWQPSPSTETALVHVLNDCCRLQRPQQGSPVHAQCQKHSKAGGVGQPRTFWNAECVCPVMESACARATKWSMHAACSIRTAPPPVLACSPAAATPPASEISPPPLPLLPFTSCCLTPTIGIAVSRCRARTISWCTTVRSRLTERSCCCIGWLRGRGVRPEPSAAPSIPLLLSPSAECMSPPAVLRVPATSTRECSDAGCSGGAASAAGGHVRSAEVGASVASATFLGESLRPSTAFGRGERGAVSVAVSGAWDAASCGGAVCRMCSADCASGLTNGRSCADCGDDIVLPPPATSCDDLASAAAASAPEVTPQSSEGAGAGSG